MNALTERVRTALAAQRELLRTRAGRWIAAVVAAMAVATAIALVALWPAQVQTRESGLMVSSRNIVPARVLAVSAAVCPVEARPGCERVDIDVGQDGRAIVSYLMLPGDEARPRLAPGDQIKVAVNWEAFGADGSVGADPSQAPYGFVDFRRGRPLLVLALLFVVLVALLGRRVGVASLIAVLAGLLVIGWFVVPAILAGTPPVWVALVGCFAAMYLSIVLVYGLGAKSLAALLGTAISLLLTGVLAVVFVHAAHITGTSGEDATLITGLSGGRVSLQGLVLAGMVIGGLGVLNDVTVSQASTVLALRRAAPQQGLTELYRGGLGVGRDHLGATVNTLVFAYAGAALPLMLLFASEGIGLGEALNREIVATEVVATLVGSIGLIVSVPLTTLAAAMLAVRLPAAELPADAHAHVH